MQSAPRALLAGLGLIGGSIGIALRRAGWRVLFFDPAVNLDDARRAGAADDRIESLEAAADVIVLATPVDVAIRILSTQHSALSTITSVCGVMGPLREVADRRGLPFIAGHPLAGSQERGLAAANGDLFRGRTWFVDGHEALVARIIGDCGAKSEQVDPAEHDAAVALTSHLPQILSTALASYLDQHGVDERFIGSGLRTFLRLAGSDASVWLPLIESNRANLEPHAVAMARLVRDIIDGDPTAFARANAFMARLER
jgi:prephenate dehydrogenase